MQIFKKKKNNKGFSLVELIVVIAIMAVLVGVLAPTLVKKVESSKLSKDKTNLDNLATAITTTLADEKYSDTTVTYTINSNTITVGDSIGTASENKNLPDGFWTAVKENYGHDSLKITSKLNKGYTLTLTIADENVKMSVAPTDDNTSIKTDKKSDYTFTIPENEQEETSSK